MINLVFDFLTNVLNFFFIFYLFVILFFVFLFLNVSNLIIPINPYLIIYYPLPFLQILIYFFVSVCLSFHTFHYFFFISFHLSLFFFQFLVFLMVLFNEIFLVFKYYQVFIQFLSIKFYLFLHLNSFNKHLYDTFLLLHLIKILLIFFKIIFLFY